MNKDIDIDNEEEILKECDFDYFYNSENCSRELCMFYNDIFKQKNSFNTRQALIDLGRIGIVLNNQDQQIAELKAENLSLQEQSIRDNQNYNEELAKLQQQIKDNTKQVCEKIRKNIVKYVYGGNLFDIKGFKEFLDQVEKGNEESNK